MSNLDYILQYLLPNWARTINTNFCRWRDLVSGNWDGYAVNADDDPFQECQDWFWMSINEDFTLEKGMIEYLNRVSDQFLKNLDEQPTLS